MGSGPGKRPLRTESHKRWLRVSAGDNLDNEQKSSHLSHLKKEATDCWHITGFFFFFYILWINNHSKWL